MPLLRNAVEKNWSSRSPRLGRAIFSASARMTSLASAFSRSEASRSAKTAERAWKNRSCAPLKRAHSSSSTSREARPAAFHRRISSR